MKFYPYEKGDTKSFEVVLTRELEVLAIVMGEGGGFHPLKGGVQKVLPCLERGRGGGRKKFQTRDFPIL